MGSELKRSTSALQAALKNEYLAQLSGKVDSVLRFASEREAALIKLNSFGAEGLGQIQEMKEEIMRNQRLGESVLAGMNAAIAKIQSLRGAKTLLASYDKDGQRREFSNQPFRTLEKRS